MDTPRSISSTPGIWDQPSIREHHRTTPAEMVGYVALRSPEWGVLKSMGLLICEAGDSCGDGVSSVGDVTGDGGGLAEDDSPGPEVRARLEGRALLTLLWGTGDGARGPIYV